MSKENRGSGSLRLSKNYRFPSSLSLETMLSSETEEKPRPAGTFFLPLYKFRDTCSRNL